MSASIQIRSPGADAPTGRRERKKRLIRWLHDPRYPLEARLAECAAFVGAAVAAPPVPDPHSEEATR